MEIFDYQRKLVIDRYPFIAAGAYRTNLSFLLTFFGNVDYPETPFPPVEKLVVI